jgi:hypothetical protein
MRALGGWPRYSQDPEGPGFIPETRKNFLGKTENRDFPDEPRRGQLAGINHGLRLWAKNKLWGCPRRNSTSKWKF